MKKVFCCLVGVVNAESSEKVLHSALSGMLRNERKQDFQGMYDRASIKIEKEVKNMVGKTLKKFTEVEVKNSIANEVLK
jgi:hypothetical protein